jgi:hypothetical protein
MPVCGRSLSGSFSVPFPLQPAFSFDRSGHHRNSDHTDFTLPVSFIEQEGTTLQATLLPDLNLTPPARNGYLYFEIGEAGDMEGYLVIRFPKVHGIENHYWVDDHLTHDRASSASLLCSHVTRFGTGLLGVQPFMSPKIVNFSGYFTHPINS